MTRGVHIGYLKGWTRTVPPFHAHTYTRHPPLPCSTLGSLPNSSQPRFTARIDGFEIRKFLLAMAVGSRGIIGTPLYRVTIFDGSAVSPLLKRADCPRRRASSGNSALDPTGRVDAVGDAVDYSSEIYARHRAIIRLEVHLTTSPYE